MKKISVLLSVLLLSFSFSFVANAGEVYIQNLGYGKKYIRLFTAETPGFYRYANGRFSFKTYVPDCVAQVKLPANGDGASFASEDGTVTFSVAGRHNLFNDSSKGNLERFIENHGASITYTAYGDGWFVASGVQNGMIYYVKELVRPKTECSLWFTYPYSQKEQYDWMIPILESNFIFL